MGSKTYLDLEQENIAMRGLLKEAVQWGRHDEACKKAPETETLCNCWLSFVERVLNPPVNLSLPKTLGVWDGVECDKCGHTINCHVNQKGLCTTESCPCFSFVPPVQSVPANP